MIIYDDFSSVPTKHQMSASAHVLYRASELLPKTRSERLDKPVDCDTSMTPRCMKQVFPMAEAMVSRHTGPTLMMTTALELDTRLR